MANSLKRKIRRKAIRTRRKTKREWRRITKVVTPGARRRACYARHYKNSDVDPNIILFESYHGMTISDSPLAVLRELMRTGEAENYEIYFSTRHMAEHRKKIADLGLPVHLVDIDSNFYAEILATAKYIVNNSSLPPYFIKREGQVHVQTWHGTPLKTLGKRMRLGIGSMYNAQHNFLQSSYIIFPNEFTRDVMMRDYNLNDLFCGKVAMMGYPRNDALRNEELAKRMADRFGLEGRTVFAYMPTWRGTSAAGVRVEDYAEELEAILAQIDGALRDDQVLFVSIHSFLKDKLTLQEYEHVFEFPEDVDTYDFLAAADVLITDYSSVFFDFSVTGKPIVLFPYDMDDYLANRGLYIDIDELPFKKVYSTEELIACMDDGSYASCDYSSGDYARRFLGYEAPNCSKLALSLMFDEPDPSIKIIDYSSNREKRWNVTRGKYQKMRSDIDTISASVNADSDIVWYNRSSFGPVKSLHLYENYLDDYNFVFTSQALVETSFEYLQRVHNLNEKLLAELDEREQRRVFGDLNIGDIRTEAFISEIGYSVVCQAVPIDAEVEVGEGGLTIKLLDERYEMGKLLLVRRRQIVWTRDIDKAERESSVVSESFDTVAAQEDIEIAYNKPLRVKVALEVIDQESGERIYAVPSFEHEEVHRDDLTLDGMPPFAVEGVGTVPDPESEDGLGESPLTATPYFVRRTGELCLLFACEGREIRRLKYSRLIDFSITDDNRFACTFRVRKGTFTPECLVLTFRSKVEVIERQVPVDSVREEDEWLIAEVIFGPEDRDFEPFIWDATLGGSWWGQFRTIPIRCTRVFRDSLQRDDAACFTDDSYIMFPYTRGRMRYLSFTYRQAEWFDSPEWRKKEIEIYDSYMKEKSKWDDKRIWLVFEKQCALAQDNGFHFFKYCMENLPEEERQHIFFVIDKDSPDYANVAPYGDQVIEFMSEKHLLYALAAEIYVGSDAKTHLYAWRARPNVISAEISRHKILFLQHGVTALKRVQNLFGRRGVTPMTYFLTTSKAEQEIVVENFGYSEERAPILGFARWDVLEDASNKKAPTILLMPTWRPWLEHMDESQFVESDYYKAYSQLIADPGLKVFLERENATLKFFIHPKLSALLSSFVSDSDRIQLVEQGSMPLNELIMECSALVTDYSSVCWDVLYLDKPVVYYQFDQELYAQAVGSYLDLETELPGAVCKDVPGVSAALGALARREYRLSDEEAIRAERWQPARDGRNCERIYQFLVKNEF